MYQLYLAESRELKPTIDALQRALNAKTDEEALQKLRKAVKSDE
jgi:hypothetical protein